MFGADSTQHFGNTVLSGDLLGGGGGVQAYHFGKKDFELGVGGKARTRPEILRGVSGSYVHNCPCEASEQKLEQKPKSGLKEIELSNCHHSNCFQKRSIF